MTNIDDLFNLAKKDPAMKDHWFKNVKDTHYKGKSDDSARLFFDIALYNGDGKYQRERTKLAETYLPKYDEHKRLTSRLKIAIGCAALSLAAYFAPVQKTDAAKMAAAGVGLACIVLGAHTYSRLKE